MVADNCLINKGMQDLNKETINIQCTIIEFAKDLIVHIASIPSRKHSKLSENYIIGLSNFNHLNSFDWLAKIYKTIKKISPNSL